MSSVTTAVAFLVALAFPLGAHGSLLGQLVGVGLSDGGSLDLFQTVAVADPGIEVSPGDASPIGAVLLPSESLDILAQSVVLTLEEGAPGGGTGYPAGTVLLLSNLVFVEEATRIVGITVATANVSNLFGVTFTDTTVSIPLDGLAIGEAPGVDVGEIAIEFDVEPVPEPAAAWLASAAIAGLALRRR